jgi:hypothetical protein
MDGENILIFAHFSFLTVSLSLLSSSSSFSLCDSDNSDLLNLTINRFAAEGGLGGKSEKDGACSLLADCWT